MRNSAGGSRNLLSFLASSKNGTIRRALAQRSSILSPMNSLPGRNFFRSFCRASLFVLTSVAQGANFGVSCDGTNDFVTFGRAPGLGSSTFTIETWFKRTGAGASVSTGTGGVTAIPLITKGRGEADATNQDMNYFLGIRASDNVLCADFEEGATGATPGLNHPIAGATVIATNVWYHAAATFDGTKWQLFLNGTLEGELVVGQLPRADSIQHAALGSALNSSGAAAGFFSGVLDEARVWNYARSRQAIADSKNLEIQNAPGLLGRWGLNEGTGSVAADSSGSGINGTLTNGAVWAGGFDPSVNVAVTRGPYLQNGTSNSIVIRWRTNLATDAIVRFGTSPAALNQSVTDPAFRTEHEVTLPGLAADTQYFYSVGTSTAVLVTGAEFSFFTAPPVGAPHDTRIWVLGDSGTTDSVAASVRNGYATFGAGRYTDVWLMLGDNAYESGTDAEFQAAVFDMYPTYLRQSVLWSAVGNHETNQLTNPDISTVPYFQIFTLPTGGEAGGVASGTEKYYSFDYGRIHFICLDSMTSSRQPGSPMLTWLQADLAATAQDWIIAFWHHPPYTKGSHNSDTERELIEMRQNILPVLEAGGVDLVLAGHSHCYERSYFINGHYGLANTFSSQNLIQTGSGREDDTGTYDKPANLAANQGAVYITAGNGGHVTNWVGGSTAEFNPTPHPAMFYSALHVGSLVIDVSGNRLDAKMVRSTGAVDDYFTIVKSVANTSPTVSITNPAEGATFAAPANIPISADAVDGDGTIVQVDFYRDNSVVGSTTTAPYTVTWNDVPPGNYVLTATATDNLGASVTSAPVNVTVTAGIPAPPTALAATPGDARVSLSWNSSAGATSYSVKRAQMNGGPYGTIIANLSATTFTDSGASNGTTYFYVVTASNASGESANSNEVSATPVAAPAIPTAPSVLSATIISRTQINLTWRDNASNESGFIIERSANGATFTQIGTPAANVTAFADAGLSPNKKYNYRVRAFNAVGQSAFSNTASAKTPK